MRILHLLFPSLVGGLDRVVHTLAVGHRERGHDVHVGALLHGREEHPFLPPLREAGVEVEALRVSPRGYLQERFEVVRLCQRLKPDVVHSHGYRPDMLDAGGVRATGTPTVSTLHGFTGGGWKNRLYEWTHVQALRRFDAVIAVSRPIAERLVKHGVRHERVRTLPNAWRAGTALGRSEARGALRVSDGVFHIGWVGRLSWEKGADVLLQGLALLGDLPLLATFVGDGPVRQQLEMRAARLGIAERVRWAGVVTDAASLFSGFDVFVLSSRTEGTPLVLFEAMAANTPVVATRVGGVPDVVSADDALLVPSEDPGALARAIRQIAADPEGAARRARLARIRLEREFEQATWLARHEEIYQEVRHRRWR